jgi:hypothetical protein
LKRPELSNPRWLDKDDAGTNKGLVGEILKLAVDCNDDMDDGAGVTFVIYDKDGNYFDEVSGVNEGGKAEAEWAYNYKHDAENPLTEKPKFTFKAKARLAKEVESGNVEITQKFFIEIITSEGESAGETSYILTLPDETIEDKTGEDGIIEKENLIPSIYRIVIKDNEKKE